MRKVHKHRQYGDQDQKNPCIHDSFWFLLPEARMDRAKNRQGKCPTGKMHGIGIKGKAEGLMAKFADFQNGCENKEAAAQPRIGFTARID